MNVTWKCAKDKGRPALRDARTDTSSLENPPSVEILWNSMKMPPTIYTNNLVFALALLGRIKVALASVREKAGSFFLRRLQQK